MPSVWTCCASTFRRWTIPPDFSPADPGSVELLRASALSETLENAYRDPDFCAFADLYGKGRTDRAAGETILHVYDFLRALPDYDKKLDEFLAPCRRKMALPPPVGMICCWPKPPAVPGRQGAVPRCAG